MRIGAGKWPPAGSPRRYLHRGGEDLVAEAQQPVHLAVLRQDPVGGGVERGGGAHDQRLGAVDRRHGAHATLTLEREAAAGEDARGDHAPQQVLELRGPESRALRELVGNGDGHRWRA